MLAQPSNGVAASYMRQAVVMPQAGHGWPNNTSKAHCGRPNCRCVPRPSGFGSRVLATLSSTASPIDAAANNNRDSAQSVPACLAFPRLA